MVFALTSLGSFAGPAAKLTTSSGLRSIPISSHTIYSVPLGCGLLFCACAARPFGGFEKASSLPLSDSI